MRVPDGFLQFAFLRNLSNAKDRIAFIQERITTQNKVNKPSDSPLANSRIMRLKNQIRNNESFANNIENSISMLDSSIVAMEGIQTETQKVLVEFTKLTNATVDEDLDVFASNIDAALNTIIDLANSEYNNMYNFGGTNHSTKPFSLSADGKSVEFNGDIGGVQKIRLSNNVFQKVNITGKELFLPVLEQSGNLSSNAAIGSVQQSSEKIYDADGNEYTITLSYTKTADNTYDLSYEIVDSDSNVIDSQTVNDLVFDSSSGELVSVNGDDPSDIMIQLDDPEINLVIDFDKMMETSDDTAIVNSLSQKADIFNTLLSIKEKLRNGERPNKMQTQIVEEFNSHVLDKLSEAGNITNRLNDTLDLLQNQKFELLKLLSVENDVDMAQELIDLESAQFSLDSSYKISSMILPKSLLDYL